MIGFDTETQGGRAVLVATPDRSLVIEPEDYSQPRDVFLAIIDFLFLENDDFVAYNLTYDAQAIFAWLPKKTQWRLARLNKATYSGVSMEWLPGKEWVIHWGKGRRRIYDCAQFYHKSLDAAAQAYLGERKQVMRPELEALKLQGCMGDALALDEGARAEVIQYCKRDAELAQRLNAKVLDGLAAIGVPADRPLSPAYLAGRYFLKGHKSPPRWINELFERSYYGGRIELFRRGWHTRCQVFDINSAYPAVAATLPDHRDLRYIIGKEPHPDALLGAYYVKVRVPMGHHIGPVPVRADVLVYPTGEFFRWVDKATLGVLAEFGFLQDIKECVEYVPMVGKTPRLAFPQIPELYALRKDESLNLAAKLALNGLYGKTAQRDRRWSIVSDLLQADMIEMGEYLQLEERYGWHCDFPYAAHITGTTRALLYRAAMADPHSVIMMATDSLVITPSVRIEHALDIGPNLGQWDNDTLQLFLPVATGVYTYQYSFEAGQDEPDRMTKFRGFNSRVPLWEALEDAEPSAETVPIKCQLPLSMLWALQNDRPVNEIATWTRELDLNSDTKRVWTGRTNAGMLRSGPQSSAPRHYERGF